MRTFKKTLLVGSFLGLESYLLVALGMHLVPRFHGKHELVYASSTIVAYALFVVVDKKMVTVKSKVLASAGILLATFLLLLALIAAMYYFWELF